MRSIAVNDGFLRPAAVLGVVILTDEDDCSVMNPGFFDPALDKAYRHPTFYDVPEGVSHL